MEYYVGLDFGTSGSRAAVVDGEGNKLEEVKSDFEMTPDADLLGNWESGLWDVLRELPSSLLQSAKSIAVDGTSGTALLVDRKTSKALTKPKLYNECQGRDVETFAKSITPDRHMASATSSTLCKLLAWIQKGELQAATEAGQDPLLLHHADWVARLLHGVVGVSDWNNALKLGFDPDIPDFPPWLRSQPWASVLPEKVMPPGSIVGRILPAAAERSGLSPDCLVCAGTTDSVAAVIAARVDTAGQAVTSLGSTLAVKLLSHSRVDDASYGVYSHRLGDLWLVGGASNTGGTVLRQHFTNQQLAELSEGIDPHESPDLDYYPLASPGERFPVYDPDMPPRLEPRPDDDAKFLHGIFEGMTNIEGDAYDLLKRMGASGLTSVLTAGRGAANDKWTAMRAARLGVPVAPSPHMEAAYGTALLAMRGYQAYQLNRSRHDKDKVIPGL